MIVSILLVATCLGATIGFDSTSESISGSTSAVGQNYSTQANSPKWGKTNEQFSKLTREQKQEEIKRLKEQTKCHPPETASLPEPRLTVNDGEKVIDPQNDVRVTIITSQRTNNSHLLDTKRKEYFDYLEQNIDTITATDLELNTEYDPASVSNSFINDGDNITNEVRSTNADIAVPAVEQNNSSSSTENILSEIIREANRTGRMKLRIKNDVLSINGVRFDDINEAEIDVSRFYLSWKRNNRLNRINITEQNRNLVYDTISSADTDADSNNVSIMFQ